MAVGCPSLETQPPHVTLVPPVNVRESDLGEALRVVRGGARQCLGPITLRLGPVTTFAPVSPVVYVGVTGDVVSLLTLRAALLRGPLQRPAIHPYVPHATLHESASEELLAAAPAALRSFSGTTVADMVTVLEEGADRVWRPIMDVAFGAAVVRGRGGVELHFVRSSMVAPDVADQVGLDGDAVDGTDRGDSPRRDRLVIEARRDGDDGEAVAVAVGLWRDSSFVVQHVAVAPAHRGQGIGSRLADELRAVAAVKRVDGEESAAQKSTDE